MPKDSLVLADALWYTQEKFKPRFMLDLATLTGAILVALGAEHAGLFSNNDPLSKRLIDAGAKEDERLWRMPAGGKLRQATALENRRYEKYRRAACGFDHRGAIPAAFRQQPPLGASRYRGVAWQDGEQRALIPSWGTGWGVRLMNRLIADHYEA